ncbi:MAG: sulfur carrier protein ThiS [Eubacteriales bacterium]|nr:sulfur carrier protein ThiS [Lachnospiraceae bacterium]MDO5127271.1 sulfur carrier protein ThiS [Eubacteriales bacterium]
MIKINGESVQIDDISVADYLKQEGYRMERIVVECNEEIVPKANYESFILHSGDVVEIVSFVGGG